MLDGFAGGESQPQMSTVFFSRPPRIRVEQTNPIWRCCQTRTIRGACLAAASDGRIQESRPMMFSLVIVAQVSQSGQTRGNNLVKKEGHDIASHHRGRRFQWSGAGWGRCPCIPATEKMVPLRRGLAPSVAAGVGTCFRWWGNPSVLLLLVPLSSSVRHRHSTAGQGTH